MTAAVQANEALLETDFMKEMVRQMRALDSYGKYDGWPAARILAPFVLTKEARRAIPVIGDPDDLVVARMRAYYNAIAALIEKECALMAVPLINLSHEGFGRALISVDKLVVMDRTLRDVHRFGFDSLSKMKDEADKVLAVALELIGIHPAAAGVGGRE